MNDKLFDIMVECIERGLSQNYINDIARIGTMTDQGVDRRVIIEYVQDLADRIEDESCYVAGFLRDLLDDMYGTEEELWFIDDDDEAEEYDDDISVEVIADEK